MEGYKRARDYLTVAINALRLCPVGCRWIEPPAMIEPPIEPPATDPHPGGKRKLQHVTGDGASLNPSGAPAVRSRSNRSMLIHPRVCWLGSSGKSDSDADTAAGVRATIQVHDNPVHLADLESKHALLTARLRLRSNTFRIPAGHAELKGLVQKTVEELLDIASADALNGHRVTRRSMHGSACSDFEAAARLCQLYQLDLKPVLRALAANYVNSTRRALPKEAHAVSLLAKRVIQAHSASCVEARCGGWPAQSSSRAEQLDRWDMRGGGGPAAEQQAVAPQPAVDHSSYGLHRCLAACILYLSNTELEPSEVSVQSTAKTRRVFSLPLMACTPMHQRSPQ